MLYVLILSIITLQGVEHTKVLEYNLHGKECQELAVESIKEMKKLYNESILKGETPNVKNIKVRCEVQNKIEYVI
jgi:hypothetical protein